MVTLRTMPLDRPAAGLERIKLSSSQGLGARALCGHECTHCTSAFATRKALATHMRVKHTKCADTARFIGILPVCPVCCVRFSNRTRLVAHLAEARSRGKRIVCCGAVVRAGLVKMVPSEVLKKAAEGDREARRDARKRGSTQPLADWPAKRLRCGGSLVAAASDAHKRLLESNPALVPANVVQWGRLKPTKRLRVKTNADDLIAQGGLVHG